MCVLEGEKEKREEHTVHTSPSSVFSTRPFTMRANSWSLSVVSLAEMMGVLMVLAAFIISLIRGTPSVMSGRVKGTWHREGWEGWEGEGEERGVMGATVRGSGSVLGVVVESAMSTVVDTHAGHSSEVECLQGHLRPWLPDALGPHRTNCSA